MSRKTQLEELLAAEPDDSFLRYALAMECFSEGDIVTGLEQMDQVLENDPLYVAAYFQKGQILASEEETDAAREVLQKGILVAEQVNDTHAAGEMLAYLESLQGN